MNTQSLKQNIKSFIGFTTGNGESITNDPKIKNFQKFTAFINSFINVTGISKEISERDECLNCSLIIIGAPTKKLSDHTLNKLRNYVIHGGKLLIIAKCGVKDQSDTNIGELFKEIQSNKDLILKDYNTKPLIRLTSDYYHFDESVIYDGGCTFSITGEVDLALYLDDSYSVIDKPVWSKNRYVGHRYPADSTKAIMVYKQIEKGAILYWGARWSFSDEQFDTADNSRFFRKMFALIAGRDAYMHNVSARMSQVQRHRLLHGFPMPEASYKVGDSTKDMVSLYSDLKSLNFSSTKKIALGIIGHPMCNPTVKGCGYCPFPHENYNYDRMTICIEALIKELLNIKKNVPGMIDRQVSSIYFGGGTANITDAVLFDKLCIAISTNLNICSETEITLEGVPDYFVKNRVLLESMRRHFPKSILRISIGVQTFDDEILKIAGRSYNSRPGSVEESVKIARDMGFKVSADFLFNLPGRGSFDYIKNDLDKAISLGIEHICWYSLVLNKSIDTEWAKNANILSTLPTMEEALENWLKLYSALTDSGYEASTVTDFKLKNNDNGHYQYEYDLRHPEKYDWLGLGSYAISLVSDDSFSKAIKLVNPCNIDEYVKRISELSTTWDTCFEMNNDDLKLYWLTRHVKGTTISAIEYRKLFNSDLNKDFGYELSALISSGLITLDDDLYALTPKGFFYADTVAGHLAWMRVNELIAKNCTGQVVKKKSDGSHVAYKFDGKSWQNSSLNHNMG